MSILHWLFHRKRDPIVYLGEVQMHLDWNLVTAFCELFGAGIGRQPDPEELRAYYADAMRLRLFHPEDSNTTGGHLLHLAFTDLRNGYFGGIDTKDYWLPLILRPSVTLRGYLVDIDSGRVLAETKVTQKPGWIRYRNPMLFAWNFFFEGADKSVVKPMGEVAALKTLKKLKKLTNKQQRIDHPLEKNRIT
ncbi:MAG: hypothetical protein AAGA50_22560 [Pseudomonadota bacterium]